MLPLAGVTRAMYRIDMGTQAAKFWNSFAQIVHHRLIVARDE